MVARNHGRNHRILIAIQARSTSKRFPLKSDAMIGAKSMTDMVLDNVEEAVKFMARNFSEPCEFNVALLIPEGDPLKRFASRCEIVEGDEYDVLSRFQAATIYYKPDFICRITADCPLLPDFVISKCIRSALYGSLDYCSNVDERFRTAPDGWDCEVISKRMMKWVFENARKPQDKEHVTTLIRREIPDWTRVGHVIDHIDRSDMKISVDTVEDLERVRKQYESVQSKVELAKSYRPNSIVFRL